jgi:FixJ family two-component response regulator
MRGEDSFVEQGYANGCADFLAKPMKEHELMAAIERHLGR